MPHFTTAYTMKRPPETKAEIREYIRQQRALVDPALRAENNKQIIAQLKEYFHEFPDLKVVHCYIPLAYEVDIRPVIQSLLDEKRILVCPRALSGGQMENRILHSLGELDQGIFGTLHPAAPDIYRGAYDCIVVPGVAFDRYGFRIGHGAGYYDRFLQQHPKARKIGVAYSYQILDYIPTEMHDIQVDHVYYGINP